MLREVPMLLPTHKGWRDVNKSKPGVQPKSNARTPEPDSDELPARQVGSNQGSRVGVTTEVGLDISYFGRLGAEPGRALLHN